MDVRAWLLEPCDPSVRFWALQDIDDKGTNDPVVIEAQELLMESSPVKTILVKQEQGGWWGSKSDMYNPKYTATTHSLLILAELGAKRTPAIEKAVEHVYLFQRESGHFLTELPSTARGRASQMKDGCCLDGNAFYYLNHFGYIDDPRTRRLLDFIVDYHDANNAGWSCRSYPIDPAAVFPKNCYMGATKILKALSMIPEQKRGTDIEAVIYTEVENVLENGIYKYLRNPDGSRKDKKGWKRFGFPLFYQSDTLEVLDTLARLGVRDERMLPAIDLMVEARQPDGRWLLENTFNGKTWFEIDKKNRPSKWITLRAMRTLKLLNLKELC